MAKTKTTTASASALADLTAGAYSVDELTCRQCGGGLTRIFMRPPKDAQEAAEREADKANPLCPNCGMTNRIRAWYAAGGAAGRQRGRGRR